MTSGVTCLPLSESGGWIDVARSGSGSWGPRGPGQVEAAFPNEPVWGGSVTTWH